jgi:hypothetical protein
VAAAAEAVDIYRALGAGLPDPLLCSQARALNFLAFNLSNLGRHAEVVSLGTEAVAIRRHLAAAHPERYLDDLARSLDLLAMWLGREQDAGPIPRHHELPGAADLERREKTLAISGEASGSTASLPTNFLTVACWRCRWPP